MSYFINPVQADQCVFLTYEGEMPPVEVAVVRSAAAGLLAANHWNRMVVDITELQSVPLALELFELGRGMASDLPPSARVALVVRPEQASQGEYVEKVARSDGVFLNFFFDPENATTWVSGMKGSAQILMENRKLRISG
jgi:hypothetical protein